MKVPARVISVRRGSGAKWPPQDGWLKHPTRESGGDRGGRSESLSASWHELGTFGASGWGGARAGKRKSSARAQDAHLLLLQVIQAHSTFEHPSSRAQHLLPTILPNNSRRQRGNSAFKTFEEICGLLGGKRLGFGATLCLGSLQLRENVLRSPEAIGWHELRRVAYLPKA